MARSVFLDFIDGYENVYTENGRKLSTGKRFFSRSYSGTMTKRKNTPSLFRLTAKLSDIIAHTSAKAYGAAALTFGLLSLIIHFMKDYLKMQSVGQTVTIVIGLVFSIVAIPLLFFDNPLPDFLQNFYVTDYIFFEFFCIKRTSPNPNIKGIPTPLAVIIGAVLALIGYFVPGWAVALIIGCAAILYITMLSPEFAFFLSILIIPYLSLIPYSDIAMSVLILTAVLSFFKKAAMGKRVVYFEQYDFLIALFVCLIMISGIFIKGFESFSSALILMIMSFGYFLSGNIITNRRLADCALNAVVIASIPPSIISAIDFISSIINGNVSESLQTGYKSCFSSTEELSIFLIVSITFGIALIAQSRRKKRLIYVSILLLNLFSLCISGEYFALLSLLLGILVYFSLKARAWSALIIPLILALPYTVYLLPRELLDSIYLSLPMNTDALPSDIISLWGASLRTLLDNIFFGIGIGADSFRKELGQYAEAGFTSSENLFIEIGLEAGAFALLVFILLLIVRLRHRVRYRPYVKNSQLSTLAPLTSVAVFCLLCYGCNHYIWEISSSFYLFFLVFGIGSAALRITKRERDERHLYYEHTKRNYSSGIDVDIN